MGPERVKGLLLDSNILIEILNEPHFLAYFTPEDRMTISEISVMEVMALAGMSDEESRRMKELIY